MQVPAHQALAADLERQFGFAHHLQRVTLFLALAIAGTVCMVTDVLFDEWSAALVAALIAAFFGWFWYGLPLLRRATSRR